MLLLLLLFFSAWYLVCTTVAHGTLRWLAKFVNKVGSTVLYINSCGVFATRVVCFLSLKQTLLGTSPSSNLGWAPFNQPELAVPHLNAGTRVVGIFVPAAPTKRYHPSGSWLSHSSGPSAGVGWLLFLLALLSSL